MCTVKMYSPYVNNEFGRCFVFQLSFELSIITWGYIMTGDSQTGANNSCDRKCESMCVLMRG